MNEPLIPGGCILLARKVIESSIWEKPPLYIKVWVYLLSKAQHKPYKGLRRGQLYTSIPEIIDNCKWRVGARWEKPTKDQIFNIIEWLRNPEKGDSESNAKATRKQRESNAGTTMITTTKATHGYLITIDNYGFYQTFDNYESNGESNDENDMAPSRDPHGTPTNPDNTNKNDKNDKKKTSSRQRKAYAEDSRPYKLAVYLHEKIMSFAGALGLAHLVEGANIQSWADDCRKLLELDKRDPQEVKRVIDWATADPFWQQNILSPASLRKKYTELAVKAAGKSKPVKRTGALEDKNAEAKQKIRELMELERGGSQEALSDNAEHV
ncbi:hypothetical protein [Paenibacillus sp. RUD330]|uniref:hypothetical protein n=1 Tax=Paenibacillus sp. RUD330 TaxID=2023772 RepID=UPI000B9298DE|nr:hypothetical protein [Paenibacillus sp. RUD330]ASS66520.1 hypothetical protein CIC07_10405 [Paenibacillus sp. RUD330]